MLDKLARAWAIEIKKPQFKELGLFIDSARPALPSGTWLPEILQITEA